MLRNNFLLLSPKKYFMRPHLRIVLVLVLVCFSAAAFAQAKKATKKANEKESVQEPPPPMEELREVRIDTASGKGRIVRDVVEESVLEDVDTTAPPADELTAEIRKLITLTGAINLGVQFAKGMQDNQSYGLPKEFYDRLYQEISTGSSRILFENAIIKAYRKFYTLEDAKALSAFYSSPVGKKSLAIMPALMEECQGKGGDIGRVAGMKVYNQLMKEGIIK